MEDKDRNKQLLNELLNSLSDLGFMLVAKDISKKIISAVEDMGKEDVFINDNKIKLYSGIIHELEAEIIKQSEGDKGLEVIDEHNGQK